MSHEYKNLCVKCGEHVITKRWVLGYNTCLSCGEIEARARKHCTAPINKSNYMLIMDVELLKQLNPKRTT
jgi:hypothetical protein